MYLGCGRNDDFSIAEPMLKKAGIADYRKMEQHTPDRAWCFKPIEAPQKYTVVDCQWINPKPKPGNLTFTNPWGSQYKWDGIE